MVASGQGGSPRMPILFVAHGGGPMPLINPSSQGGLSQHLKSIGKTVHDLGPTAVLIISAHWEERNAAVLADPQPELLFDYYGFPPEAYKLQYAAPGEPEVASKAAQLIRSKGMACDMVKSGRGWDHGVFVPLMLMLEAADIPVVQVSLLKSLDPLEHLRLGEALAPLRDEGVFILGSGLSYHNLRALLGGEDRAGMAASSRAFHSWLKPAVSAGRAERWAALEAWTNAPSARDCHPREEHLLPLHVCAGAAGSDPGHVVYNEDLMGAEVASFWFGNGAGVA